MTQGRTTRCPLCDEESMLHRPVDGVEYFFCGHCDFIFADPELLERTDAGEVVREYSGEYWAKEMAAARERSYGSSIARFAEAVLYTTIPIRNFIDIGSGPGYLLDALSSYLPTHSHVFHAVEKFPPALEDRTRNANYHCASLESIDLKFECGTCIEVLEHLTPKMASSLADSMASVSVRGSLYLFNTGLTEYVINEDPGYLDPYRRGHITCWSVTAAAKVFSRAGFVVHRLRGKTWAFLVEYKGAPCGSVEDRIWSAPTENVQLLRDPKMGDAIYLLGRESARAW